MRYFKHTAKAVRHGCPSNRVFVVVRELDDHYLLAWKCVLSPKGIGFWVQGTTKETWATSEVELVKLLDKATETDSEPTAVFKPDSFYREYKLADLLPKPN